VKAAKKSALTQELADAMLGCLRLGGVEGSELSASRNARCIAGAALLTAAAVLSTSNAKATCTALTLDGEVASPVTWTPADFAKLPRTSLKVQNSSGQEDLYEGVDLAVLLAAGGVPLKDALKGQDVAKYLHAEGDDGFVAVFALPEFDNITFLVADSRNGAALAPPDGPFQTISPQEQRHSRWVKDVCLLRIKKSVK
jgi:hypothetical protein